MNTSWRISRRTLLRGIGAAVALPALDVMMPNTARAVAEADAALPRRMAYLFFPNGVPTGTWFPPKVTDDGALVGLNEWMSPLQPFRDDIVIPTNIWTPMGTGHVEGPVAWLTEGGYDERRVSASGISVDQLAAKHIGDKTLLPSLELSVKGEGFFSNDLPRNAVSWNEKGMPLVREIEPRVVFDRMFSRTSGGLSTQTVMDSVLADARSLQKYLSAADRKRLDQYFESVNALEKRIHFAERHTTQIARDKALTDTLTVPAPGIPSNHESYIRLMFDLIVLAFQTDATRVCTFMLDHEQSNRYLDFIGNVKGTWHALSHYQNATGMTEDDDGKTSWESVEQKRAMYAEVNRWHHRQFAYLLGRMKSIQEPDGRTLLDNSMLVYGSSLGDGHDHGKNHLPTVIAGRAGNTIKTGRQIEFKKPQDLASVHLAFLHRMGVQVESFGLAKGPMEELAG